MSDSKKTDALYPLPGEIYYDKREHERKLRIDAVIPGDINGREIRGITTSPREPQPREYATNQRTFWGVWELGRPRPGARA